MKTNRPIPGQKQIFNLDREAVEFAVQDRENKMPILTGYAMKWNTLSDDRGGYKVRLKAGSAKPANENTFAVCDHDFTKIMGCAGNGTLKMTSDDKGLKVEIDPADTSYNRDMVALIRRGDVNGMSFSMLWANCKYEVTEKEGEPDIIEYSEFEFDEVTVTGRPAFTDTSIASEFAQAKPPAPTPLRNRLSVEIQEMNLPPSN
jgi:HK97 family phage prohead protease